LKNERQFNLDTHILFIDYEKAVDITQRQITLHILKSRNIPGSLLKTIADPHTKNKISIKFNSKLTKLAKINIKYVKFSLSSRHCLT
jgi:hypothetical protein